MYKVPIYYTLKCAPQRLVQYNIMYHICRYLLYLKPLSFSLFTNTICTCKNNTTWNRYEVHCCGCRLQATYKVHYSLK